MISDEKRVEYKAAARQLAQVLLDSHRRFPPSAYAGGGGSGLQCHCKDCELAREVINDKSTA